jgi:hypothetical protein
LSKHTTGTITIIIIATGIITTGVTGSDGRRPGALSRAIHLSARRLPNCPEMPSLPPSIDLDQERALEFAVDIFLLRARKSNARTN